MNKTDHTLTLSHNEYGWFGECECSNPDFEGTGLVSWWSMDRDEVHNSHLDHLEDVDL